MGALLTMAQIVSLRMIEVLLIATTVMLASLSTKGNSSGSRGVVSQGLKAVLISKSAEYSSATTSTSTSTCFQYPLQNAACFKSIICTNNVTQTSVACPVVGIAAICAYNKSLTYSRRQSLSSFYPKGAQCQPHDRVEIVRLRQLLPVLLKSA